MNNIFKMYGRVIQVYRYKAEYTLRKLTSDGKFIDSKVVGYFSTKEEAESKGGTVTALDTSDYEWLDGIEVADVPDTYAEAVKIFEMGEEAYRKMLDKPAAEDDMAAMLVDLEYRTTLLELNAENAEV